MHRFSTLAVVSLLCCAGCEAEPPKPQDLGRIVYDTSEIPGINEANQAPEPAAGSDATAKEPPAEEGTPVQAPESDGDAEE
jgi:hypothetical protein